jgi:hypothetical protein
MRRRARAAGERARPARACRGWGWTVNRIRLLLLATLVPLVVIVAVLVAAAVNGAR